MGRRPRLFLPGATYHVYCRVARGEFVFDDDFEALHLQRCDPEFKCRLDQLDEAISRRGWQFNNCERGTLRSVDSGKPLRIQIRITFLMGDEFTISIIEASSPAGESVRGAAAEHQCGEAEKVGAVNG